MAKKSQRKLVRLAKRSLDGRRLELLALTAGAGFVAERLAFNALEVGWRKLRGDDPPTDPDHLDVDWKDALAWSAVTGLTMALVGLAARRGALVGWKKASARFA